MVDVLTFQLVGPFHAWGDLTVGEVRSGVSRPPKSSVLGFLGAAMGISRGQSEWFQKMDRSLGYAVRIDYPGKIELDYHTVETPVNAKFKPQTRTDELTIAKTATTVTSREFQVGCRFTVALWAREEVDLESLAEGLRFPKFSLFLGRRAYPPALPPQPQIFRNLTDLASLFLVHRPLNSDFDWRGAPHQVRLFWEVIGSAQWSEWESAPPIRFVHQRRDRIRAAEAHTFDIRLEAEGFLEMKKEVS